MKKNYQKSMKNLPKDKCEIESCTVTNKFFLHKHHIVERKEIGTSNDSFNCAILCAEHHALTHSGALKIIGVFPSTAPHGRKLVYILDGKPNIPGITESYFQPQTPQMKINTKD